LRVSCGSASATIGFSSRKLQIPSLFTEFVIAAKLINNSELGRRLVRKALSEGWWDLLQLRLEIPVRWLLLGSEPWGSSPYPVGSIGHGARYGIVLVAEFHATALADREAAYVVHPRRFRLLQAADPTTKVWAHFLAADFGLRSNTSLSSFGFLPGVNSITCGA
jgi:hypothetical protein